MRININDFGHELYEFTKKSHRDESEESLRNQLKELFAKHGIDDSNFALISVAVSGNGVAAEAKNTTTYIGKIAKKLFEKEERIKYREQFGKDPEKPEDVKKIKQDKPFINLDVHKLSKLSSRIDIESYITRQLAQQNRDGLDFSEFRNKTVTYYTQNEFDMPINLSEIEGKPLVSGLADSIIAKQSSTKQIENAQLTEEQKHEKDKKTLENEAPENEAELETENDPAEQSKEMVVDKDSEQLKREQENKDKPVQKPVQKTETTKTKDEEEFDISEIGEGSSDINYFVGYNKDEVNGLFRNKPELVKAFAEFVARFNKLMNRLLNQELNEDTVDRIQNDIDPEFLKVAAECSNYGAEGAQIQNLCRGMVAIFNRTCDAEKEGKNINGLKLKANLETTQALDHTDRDGLRREQTTKDENGKPSIIKAIDNSVGTNGLVEDALTEEDMNEINLFGITGILTHSAMEAFRREPEYELLQNMNMLGLSKSDTPPM